MTQFFKIDKTCIDCDVEYEAKYHEIGGLNCHVCGLTSHGCKPNEKVQAAELCGMSKGYKWLCYDCTKEVKLIKEKNRNWEEGLEEHTKKNAVNTACKKWASAKPTEISVEQKNKYTPIADNELVG